MLVAGADPNTANKSGYTALDIALGPARQALASVTSHITEHHSLGGMECLARSLTPDKLSTLRSSAGLLARSPSSPARRVTHRYPATSCPTTPARRRPSTSKADTKSVKEADLVKKVNRKIP